MGLKAGMWALRLEFGLQDWELGSRLGLGLETGISASRLGFEGWGMEKKEEASRKSIGRLVVPLPYLRRLWIM